jgi:predicted hotdog family 3-hydroxylacyl-ACP dehydratase
LSLDHNWIASRTPHHGSMCLLDEVDTWDETRIVCKANSHRLDNNPLRSNGSLGIVNGIEYAAQAMAVHGAILAGDQDNPNAGFLASIRDVKWCRARLDDISSELVISAERISGNEITVLYSFEVHGDGVLLMSGRASVILKVPVI